MGIFDVDEQKLRNMYKRGWVEANHGFVNPHKYPYLEKALIQYARENKCSFDQALRIAKSIR
ncbi:MAG: hypothetical protein Q4E53_13605 [Eubacteriales bacterium]|nr:hypothetical protein [Eubacteriales bacterium]